MAYSGYLSPHIDLIMQMHRNGAKKVDIARHLYGLGVCPWWVGDPYYANCYFDETSLAPLVGYVIRKQGAKPRAKPVRVTKTVQDWQTWTPEMQAAEFAAGYA